MVRLTILGDVDLRADGGNVVGSILSQPRRLALLVYLALESKGGGVQRDRLLGVFWPDLPQDKARQALRTALHFLRRSLGRNAIAGQGDLVGLDPACVSCDATELRAALDAGDADEALRLYAGDLLPGFYLDGGPVEFERWLDDARRDLRRQAARAAWALAEAQERAGNDAGAGAWARRAARLSEEDEASVRRAIALLGRIGDRVGALALYADLERRLRDDFEATPSAETEAEIARVREGEGARTPPPEERRREPEAGVGEIAREERGAGGSAASPPPGGQGRAPRRPLRALMSGAVTVVLAVAFYSLWGLDRVDPAGSVPGAALRPVIQVEAIRDFTTDGGGADLAGALTMELAGRLGETEGLLVVPVAAGDPAADPSAPSPGYIVRGGLLRSDSVARVTAMLLDGESGATLHRVTAEGLVGDPATTVDQLVEHLGREVRREVGRAVADFQRRASTRDSRALELVRVGLHELEAADSLRRIGAHDAAAHMFESADSQLALAQAAAPGWPEPSVQRAEVALRRMWLHLLPPNRDSLAVAADLHHGILAADAALAVARNDPAALELRGSLSYWIWLTRSAGSENGDDAAAQRAEEDLRRATLLDPSRGRAWAVLSALHEARGDFAAANLAARRAHRADPYLRNSQEILVRLFTTSLEIGDTASARTWCGELGRRLKGSWLPGYCQLEQLAWRGLEAGVGPDSVWRIVASTTPDGPAGAHIRPRLEMLAAVAFARSGLRTEAERVIQSAVLGVRDDPQAMKLEAWAWCLLGDHDVAVDLLLRAAAANPRGGGGLLVSRRFAVLRHHPAFPATQIGGG